jgi:hypothetical protein
MNGALQRYNLTTPQRDNGEGYENALKSFLSDRSERAAIWRLAAQKNKNAMDFRRFAKGSCGWIRTR